MANAGSVIPKSIAAPGARVDVPDGRNAFAGISAGLTDIAETAAHYEKAMTEARDQSALVQGRLAANKQLNDLYSEFEKDADPATAPDRFATKAREIAQPYYGQFATDDARNRFDLDFGQAMESRRIALKDVSFRRETDTAVAALDTASDDFAHQAAYARNEPERQSAIESYSRSVMGVADAGMITHVAAGQRVEKFKNNLALYDGRAAIEANPAAARKALDDENQFSALEPLQRIELRAHADARVKQAEAAARQVRTEARMNATASLADLDARVASGLPVSKDVVDQAHRDVRASGDPRQMRHLERSIQGAYFADGLRGLNQRQVEGRVAEVTTAASTQGADAAMAAQVQGGRKFLDTMNRELGQDPLAWAASQGVARLAPLSLTGQDTPMAWQNRIRAAKATADHYSIAPRYLTAAEGDAVRAHLTPGADPQAKLQILKTLVGGLGSRAIPELSRLGVSQALVTAGGLLTAGPAHARTAFDIVNGEAALAASSKGGDGQSALRPGDRARSASTAGKSRFFGGVVAPQGFPQVMQATAFLPGEAARISEAADAWYAAQAPQQGLSGKDAADNGRELYFKGLQLAAGARFEGETQMGGVTHYRGRPVIAPAIVAADAFEGVVQHLTADDLAHASASRAAPVDASGKPVARDIIKRSWLVTAGDGLYALSLTDPANGTLNPVRDAKGGIYRLNFPTALTILQARAAKGDK